MFFVNLSDNVNKCQVKNNNNKKPLQLNPTWPVKCFDLKYGLKW